MNDTTARVMIVDDSLFMRQVLRHIVEANGFTVVGEADSLDGAVESYRACRPDVVTMDITLDKIHTMSGVEALRAIRAIDPRARVIIISALDQQAVLREAIEAGAAEFVAKPFDEAQVISALQAAIRSRWEVA